jgi:hypothetical protein
MTASEVVATSLPFAMAYLVQVLRPAMPRLADNTLQALLGKGERFEGAAREWAVQLAIHFYAQVTFIITVLLSTVSAMALTLTSPVPMIGVLVAFVLLTIILLWFFRWQTLASSRSERRKRDWEMALVAPAVTTLMLMATITARMAW